MAKKTQKIVSGLRLSDGTIYVGVSPETGLPIFALPFDARREMVIETAIRQAGDYTSPSGVSGWRLPTRAEWDHLLRPNIDAIGGFTPDGKYWIGAPLFPGVVWYFDLADRQAKMMRGNPILCLTRYVRDDIENPLLV